MEKIENKKRIDYIDVAKFISMFCVIFAHALYKFEYRYLIYSFHLPVFFILNGMTLKIKEDEDFASFFKKKIKSYIIPIFCLGILCILFEMAYCSIIGSPKDDLFFSRMIIALIEQKRTYAIWFVGALLFSDIFFFMAVKISKHKMWLTCIISILFLLLGIYFNINHKQRFVWNIDVALFGVFFVFIGYFISSKCMEKVYKYVIDKKWLSLIISLILLVGGYFLSTYNFKTYGTHLEMWAMSYDKYYLTIPSAILLSLGVILLSNVISNKVLAKAGRTTFVLLAFHQVLTLPIFSKFIAPNWYKAIGNLPGNSFDYIMYGIAATVFSILVLICLYYLIIYSPLAFILNKKTPDFYTKLIKKIKSKLKKNESLS